MKKSISIILIVLMVLLASVPVFAFSGVESVGNENLQMRYTNILYLGAGLSIDASGKATCMGVVQPNSLAYDCYLTVDLQKKSGSSWSTIATWKAQDLEGYGAELEAYRYVTTGTYRVKSTGVVKNPANSTSETGTKYSAEVNYNL